MSRPDRTILSEWILVIEDDPDSRDAIRLVLEQAGYLVEAAASGRAGLAAFSTRPWSLVVLDLRLPDLSGVEVLRAIKVASPATAVIMVTGHGSLASAVEAVNEAVFAYLEKPISPDQLLSAIARALARRGVEEHRRQLAAIVDGSADAIIGQTLDGTIVSWNPAAERLYGYAAHEVIGRSVSLLVPGELPDELAQILARLRRGERIEHYETVRVRSDGSRVDVSLTVSPIRDAAGAVIGASAITRDITRRKRAEATSRALTRVSHELVGSLDLEQVSARVVSAVLDVVRVRRAALHRRDATTGVLTCVAIAGAADVPNWIGRTLAPGEGLAGLAVSLGRPVWSPDLLAAREINIPDWLSDRLTADGLRAGVGLPLMARGETLGALTLIDEPGRVFAPDELEILAAFADQAALAMRIAGLFDEVRQQRDFLRSVAENSADGIVTTDVRGRITYVSPGAVRMFGRPADEVVGQRVASYYKGGAAEAWSVARRLRQDGEVRNYETALLAKDGAWVPISASVSLLRDGQGRVVGTVGVIRDLTDREAAEAARREASELRAVTLLAGGVAHEVNNPLAVIVGQLELLALGRALDSRAATRIERALTAAKEIKNIASRLTRIGRIQTTVPDKFLPPILDIRRSAGDAVD
ncbi:MAG TPA: PAS domain S-box protein [Methylomirabilota bacterium]|jgi:PAS domain S-box-containing protein|nr:PAS domain S-box protein [Methylomirabilota bacterium]